MYPEGIIPLENLECICGVDFVPWEKLQGKHKYGYPEPVYMDLDTSHLRALGWPVRKCKMTDRPLFYCVYYPEWTDYGELRDYRKSSRELRRQFVRCDEVCKNLFDGRLYYCFRSAHICDLGFCEPVVFPHVEQMRRHDRNHAVPAK